MDDGSIALPFVTMEDDILYERDEFHHDPEEVVGNLLTFVYDIPYFGACGVFPPIHVINQIFASGSCGGGMGPGATWSPFMVDAKTYAELVAQVRATNPASLGDKSRFNDVQFREDQSFDAIQDLFGWMQAACEKHQDWYRSELKKRDSL